MKPPGLQKIPFLAGIATLTLLPVLLGLPALPAVLLYQLLTAALGLHIILFFRQYGNEDQAVFGLLFAAAALSAHLRQRDLAPALTTASAAFFATLSFLPRLYLGIRDSANERLNRSYTPLIEEHLANERLLAEREQEKTRFETYKESYTRLSDTLRTVNTFLTVAEISAYLKDTIPDRLGTDNLVVVIRLDDRSRPPDQPPRRVFSHGLAEPFLRYVGLVEENILRVLDLSGLTHYTLHVPNDWPDPEPPDDDHASFLVIPFHLAKRPIGFVGTFTRHLPNLRDLDLNFAVFTVRNVSLAFGKVLLYERIKHLAMRDGLTRLFLRRVFKERLADEFARSRRYHTPLSLVLMDVDRFKLFNDRHGHLLGDEVLRRIGSLILEAATPPMVPCRYGGEEFAVLCPATDTETFAASLQETVRRTEIVSPSGEPLKVTVSIGIAHLTPDVASAEELVRRADEALYRSKNSGRDRITVYTPNP